MRIVAEITVRERNDYSAGCDRPKFRRAFERRLLAAAAEEAENHNVRIRSIEIREGKEK